METRRRPMPLSILVALVLWTSLSVCYALSVSMPTKDAFNDEDDKMSHMRGTGGTLPGIYKEKRETLREERDTLIEKRNTLGENRETIREERDTLIEKRNTFGENRETIREKRDTLREDEQTALDYHNELRANEGASSMKRMSWDVTLGDMAVTWARGCSWSHGQPRAHPNFTSVGQNLYYTTGQSVNVTAAIGAWFKEKDDLDFDSLACSAVCGHYTQVVWDRSYVLGCAYADCPLLDDPQEARTIPNAHLYVCNYAPGGNFQNQHPYKKGDACSQCPDEHFACLEGLCSHEEIEDCPECTCESPGCQNGGNLTESCRCQCVPGYMAATCELACADLDSRCGAGWYFPQCTHDEYGPAIRAKCRKMCCQCEPSGGYSQKCIDGPIPPYTVMGDPGGNGGTSGGGTSGGGNSGGGSNSGSNTGGGVTSIVTSVPFPTGVPTPTPYGEVTTPGASTLLPTGTGVDAGCLCENGGTGMETQGIGGGTDEEEEGAVMCRCTCSEEYYGDMCQFKVSDLDLGVLLQIDGNMALWPDIWEVIQKQVAAAVNDMCNIDENFVRCCPESQTKQSGSADYVANVSHAAGYPNQNTEDETIDCITMAAYYPDQGLCQSGEENAGGSRRKRRQLSDEQLPLVPQDVLVEALGQTSVKSDLNKELQACCQASVLDVVIPTLPDSDASTGTDGGLPIWAYILIILLVLLLLTIVVVIIIMCCTKWGQSKWKKNKYSSEEPVKHNFPKPRGLLAEFNDKDVEEGVDNNNTSADTNNTGDTRQTFKPMGLVAEFPKERKEDDAKDDANGDADKPGEEEEPTEHLKDDTHLASDRLPPAAVDYCRTKQDADEQTERWAVTPTGEAVLNAWPGSRARSARGPRSKASVSAGQQPKNSTGGQGQGSKARRSQEGLGEELDQLEQGVASTSPSTKREEIPSGHTSGTEAETPGTSTKALSSDCADMQQEAKDGGSSLDKVDEYLRTGELDNLDLQGMPDVEHITKAINQKPQWEKRVPDLEEEELDEGDEDEMGNDRETTFSVKSIIVGEASKDNSICGIEDGEPHETGGETAINQKSNNHAGINSDSGFSVSDDERHNHTEIDDVYTANVGQSGEFIKTRGNGRDVMFKPRDPSGVGGNDTIPQMSRARPGTAAPGRVTKVRAQSAMRRERPATALSLKRASAVYTAPQVPRLHLHDKSTRASTAKSRSPVLKRNNNVWR